MGQQLTGQKKSPLFGVFAPTAATICQIGVSVDCQLWKKILKKLPDIWIPLLAELLQ